MDRLTNLEQAILTAICSQYPAQKALTQQVAAARVCSRQNTGAGFFTRLEVDRIMPAVTGCGRALGYIHAEVHGLIYGMGFVLFLRDGYLDCLEGFTDQDSTEHLDLTSLRPTRIDMLPLAGSKAPPS